MALSRQVVLPASRDSGLERFAGKTIIVSGATAGIGAAAARRFAMEGGKLVLTGRNRARGEVLASELGGDKKAVFVPGDVRERATADRVVEAVLKHHGDLDVLVNNAGIDHTGDLVDTPVEEVRELFEVNVFGCLHMLQAAARVMRAAGTGGAIVNVASRLASIGVPTMALYGASKGALVSLTRGAAVELARHDIRVNAVAPGMTRSPLLEAWLAEEGEEAAARAAAGNPPRSLRRS